MPSASRHMLAFESRIPPWRVQADRRFADMHAFARCNPVTAAGTVFVGVFVATLIIAELIGWLGGPAPSRARSLAETNGIAPRAAVAMVAPARSDRAKCQEQTWPDLPRSCLTRPAASASSVRVIPIDGTASSETAAATPPPTWGVPNLVSANASPRAAAVLTEAREAAPKPVTGTASANQEIDDRIVRVLDVPSQDDPAQRRRVIIRVDRHTIF